LSFSESDAAVSVIKEDELKAPRDYSIIKGHLLVAMPGFHCPGVYGREVNLAKLQKHIRVSPEHMHDLAPLVMNLSQRSDHHASYQFFSSGK
jgi:hypothetical protein